MTIENSSHCVQEMRRSCGLGLEGVRGRWMTMPRHAEASESHPGRWRPPGPSLIITQQNLAASNSDAL